MQMRGLRDIVIYWPGPRAFSVVQMPWGWAHISIQKPWGAKGGGGNRSNLYLHVCQSFEGNLIISIFKFSRIQNKMGIAKQPVFEYGQEKSDK